MLLALSASLVLAFIVVLIHYETLRFTSSLLPRLSMQPRPRILVVILAVFCAHLVEIWLYALCYYLLASQFGLGGSSHEHHFMDYFYLSSESYASLGYRGTTPLGSLRLMTGIEAIVGLTMIGWSASFTYLTMEKFWGLHGSGKKRQAK